MHLVDTRCVKRKRNHNMDTLIDISWPVTSDMTTYKDRNDVTIEQYKHFQNDGARETRISASLHTGTHVDAPSHFCKDGDSIDTYALSQLCGDAYVVDCTHVTDCITPTDIPSACLQSQKILLFKTRNSACGPNDSFNYQFIYLGKEAAALLADHHVKAVGIDYLGIERNQPGHETHKTLLANNIPIIEGLRLSYVNTGEYQLWCLPLHIPGVDAAPARAVLYEQRT